MRELQLIEEARIIPGREAIYSRARGLSTKLLGRTHQTDFAGYGEVGRGRCNSALPKNFCLPQK